MPSGLEEARTRWCQGAPSPQQPGSAPTSLPAALPGHGRRPDIDSLATALVSCPAPAAANSTWLLDWYRSRYNSARPLVAFPLSRPFFSPPLLSPFSAQINNLPLLIFSLGASCDTPEAEFIISDNVTWVVSATYASAAMMSQVLLAFQGCAPKRCPEFPVSFLWSLTASYSTPSLSICEVWSCFMTGFVTFVSFSHDFLCHVQ